MSIRPEGQMRDIDAATGWVDLYWIPLGAGAHFVRLNGQIYEAVSALAQRRPRYEILHSALVIALDDDRFAVEMTPVPREPGAQRGVVAEGPVGARALGRFRPFRYEVRRWRDGVIPDLEYAIASPVRATADAPTSARVLEVLPSVPPLVWGRDELGSGEMWSCNSIISWALARAGVDVAHLPLPARGRAPGWDVGVHVASGAVGPRAGVRGRHRASRSASSRPTRPRPAPLACIREAAGVCAGPCGGWTSGTGAVRCPVRSCRLRSRALRGRSGIARRAHRIRRHTCGLSPR